MKVDSAHTLPSITAGADSADPSGTDQSQCGDHRTEGDVIDPDGLPTSEMLQHCSGCMWIGAASQGFKEAIAGCDDSIFSASIDGLILLDDSGVVARLSQVVSLAHGVIHWHLQKETTRSPDNDSAAEHASSTRFHNENSRFETEDVHRSTAVAQSLLVATVVECLASIALVYGRPFRLILQKVCCLFFVQLLK
jgi:hypothetical protein